MKCSLRVGQHHLNINGHPCKDDAFAKCSNCKRGFCENHNLLDKCEREICHYYVCIDCRNSTTIFNNLLCKSCHAIADRMNEESVSEDWYAEFEEWMDYS